MSLMNLYKQVSSPFENTYLVSELIQLYLNSVNYESFYDRIMLSLSIKNCYSEEPLLEKYAADRFYAMLFNHWKDSMLETPINSVIKEKYSTDEYTIEQLKTALRNIPPIKSLNDLKSETRGEVDFLLERYRRYYVDREWTDVTSYYTNPTQVSPINVEHFLYINLNSKTDIYRFSKYFVEKCNNKHLPYDFKFTTQLNYDDVLIIGAATENLIDYLNILRAIKDEYPEVLVSIKRPHILTGKIDGWIGYGTAPKEAYTSYIKKRSMCLYKTIDTVMDRWFIREVSEKSCITEQVSYQEYIAQRIIDSLIDDLEQKNQNYLIKMYISKNIKKVITNLVMNHWEDVFKATKDIKVHISPNKDLIYGRHRLKSLIHDFVKEVVRNDQNFKLAFNQELSYVCDEMGIDYQTFCFDKDIVTKMQNMDSIYVAPTTDSDIKMTKPTTSAEDSKAQPTLLTDNCVLENEYWVAPDGLLWASYEDYLNSGSKSKQYKI